MPNGWTLDGDDSIRQRPVDRVAVPLRRMGAQLSAREERLPPLEITGAPLRGIEYDNEVDGVTVIVAVITHAIALAALRVPVHVLGWSVRGGMIAAGLFLACCPSVMAAAWKDRTGESRR